MRYLLDTSVLSDIVKKPGSPAEVRFSQCSPDALLTSIIVVAEARFGLVKNRAFKTAHRLEQLLTTIDVAPFETPADSIYADLRVQLERAGTPIGGNDMLIAAHALALDATLVTANEREFRRVPHLEVENWAA
jgi:tRNA(fMet)-specific endonuclease VapC